MRAFSTIAPGRRFLLDAAPGKLLLGIALAALGLVAGIASVVFPPFYVVGIIGLVVTAVWLIFSTHRVRLLTLLVAGSVTRYTVDAGPVNIRPEQVITIVVTLVILGGILMRTREWRGSRLNWVLLGWLAVNFIAALASQYPQESLRTSLLMVVTVIPFILVQNLVRNEDDFGFALKCIAVIGFLEALFGLVALFVFRVVGQNFGVQIDPITGVSLPYGTQWEGNIFGSFVMASLLVTLTLLIMYGRTDSRSYWMWGFMALVDVLAVLLSLARGAWLGLALGVLVLAVPYLRGKQQQLLKLAGIGMVAALLGAILIVLTGQSITTLTSDIFDRLQTLWTIREDPTVLGRTQSNLLALNDWSQSPLIGLGPGTFGVRYTSTSNTREWISNLFISSLHDSGLVGIILFSVLLIAIVAAAWLSYRRLPSGALKANLRALLVGVVGLLVAYQATDASVLAFTWVYLGLLVVGARIAGVGGWVSGVGDQKANTQHLTPIV